MTTITINRQVATEKNKKHKFIKESTVNYFLKSEKIKNKYKYKYGPSKPPCTIVSPSENHHIIWGRKKNHRGSPQTTLMRGIHSAGMDLVDPAMDSSGSRPNIDPILISIPKPQSSNPLIYQKNKGSISD